MNKNKKSSTVFLYGVGWAMVVIGVALILLWWPQVVQLFKATVGIILAIAGLLVLYIQKQK